MGDRRPFDEPMLAQALSGRWARVTVVAQTASTNADLLADTSAPDRAVLVAEHQLAGRGRLERTWSSPPGTGLTFSVLLRPPVALPRWGWLPLLAGVALGEAVGAHSGVRVALKWPNDLLAAADPAPDGAPGGKPGGKLAGILTQTGGEAVVIGIGLNVASARDELPVESATSLALCGAGSLDRGELLVAVLARLDARYSEWVDASGDAEGCGLAAAYRAACATVGQLVAVSCTDGSVVRGTAVGLDSGGRLRVAAEGAAHGGVRVIGAGDVEHLRTA